MPVTPVLDKHYFWALRYHFFLGYRRYTLYGSNGSQSKIHREYEHRTGAVATSNASR